MFSGRFSEGQILDINEGFPSDSLPYNDSYDYLSDSDLEDDECDSDPGTPAKVPESVLQGGQDASAAETHHASAPNFIKLPNFPT